MVAERPVVDERVASSLKKRMCQFLHVQFMKSERENRDEIRLPYHKIRKFSLISLRAFLQMTTITNFYPSIRLW